MTKRALVLSGGGSKGAYQVGVLLALKKLNIEYQIVTGTSVGALNGLIAVQKDIYQAYNLWKNIDFSTVYDKNVFDEYQGNDFDVYKKYAKKIVEDGGVNINGVEKIIDKLFRPGKFYGSNIDYGLATYNLSKRKPVYLTKKNLPQEKIKDYVIASATCFPAFKPKNIDGDLYIDGGYHDNLPINLAIELGADEVIAVNLKSIGFIPKIEKENVKITTITPRNKIVSFLVFDKKLSHKAINFGYNDTLKTFGKLDGNKFSFKVRQIKKAFCKYYQSLEKLIDKLETEDKLICSIINRKFYKKNKEKTFENILENAGIIFELSEDSVYVIRKYNKKLKQELINTKKASIKVLIENVKDKKYFNAISKKEITKLFYDAIKIQNINSISKLVPIFPNEFIGALYLNII